MAKVNKHKVPSNAVWVRRCSPWWRSSCAVNRRRGHPAAAPALGSRTDSRRAYRDRRCGTCRLHDAVEGVRARPAIRCGLGGQTNHALAQCNCSSARVVVADVRCGFQARSDSRRPLRGRARQRCRRNGLPSTRAFVVAASARSRRRGARDISGSRFPRAVQSGWPHWTGWCRTSPVVTQQSPIHTLICTRVRGARAWRELSGHRLGSSGRTRHGTLSPTAGCRSARYGAASAIGPFLATGRRPDIEIEDRGGQIQRAACVVDEAAAAQLANAEFYRYVVKYKPAQQKC
jgi:hypothetical protein